MTTSSERRLHPLSVIFDVGPRLSKFLLPMAVLLFSTRDPITLLVVFIGFPLVAGLISIVRYLRFSYRYGPAELVIHSGILTRNERIIPYSRIQNIDASQNLLQRICGVVVVHVQTGGGAAPEASLRVLPAAALQEMRTRVLEPPPAPLDHHDALEAPTLPAAPAAPEPERRTLLHLRPPDLLLAGFIENRGMVLIFAALALFEQTGLLGRSIDTLFQQEHTVFARFTERWSGVAVSPVRIALLATGALLFILLFVRLLSTVWAVIRLFDFRLARIGDELHAEYGLLTRVSATIPLRRIQSIIIRETLLHRALGRRSVVVETAGGWMTDTGPQLREPIAPIIPEAHLAALLHELHPGFDPGHVEWQPVHPRAFGRMVRGSLAGTAALGAASWLLVEEWALAVFLVLLASAVARARLRARHLGWGLTADAIVLRDGALSRSIRVARFNRVQVPALHRGPLDLRMNMALVRADTAGARGGLVVPFLGHDAALDLHRDLTARTAATAFTW